MAKADKVTQVIGFSRIGKIRKANNVVNVKLPSVFRLSYAAPLTGVIVPSPSAAALTLPVCSIVILVIATLPIVMVRAAMPLVSAIGRTEAETSRTFNCGGDDDMIAALFAIVFVGWLGGWSWSYQTLPTCFLVALSRTNRNQLGARLEWLALKFLQANLARVGVVILHSFSAQLIRTFAAASGLPSMFEALRISEIGTVAVGASSFDHGHIIA